jgi:lipid II:glycine glycyltransferase (peptidoglycan interpeptide bridge formation enzyme)
VFTALYQETARRERFTPFSQDFLAAEFKAFRKNNAGMLFFAEHAGDVLAAALIILNGKTGFYHQGASSRLKPDVPAASVLHWEIIRELKRRWCTHYNFWGVAPRDDPQHPWAGLSLFKKGFGGEARAYLHAQDRPLQLRYWLTYAVESARRLRRGV